MKQSKFRVKHRWRAAKKHKGFGIKISRIESKIIVVDTLKWKILQKGKVW